MGRIPLYWHRGVSIGNDDVVIACRAHQPLCGQEIFYLVASDAYLALDDTQSVVGGHIKRVRPLIVHDVSDRCICDQGKCTETRQR